MLQQYRVQLPLSTRRADPEGPQPRHRAQQDHRPGGTQRLRQEHRHPAGATLLRPRRRLRQVIQTFLTPNILFKKRFSD